VGNLFGLKDRLAAIVACLAAPSSDNWRDAYEGAREDLLDWKRRAQVAEAKLRPAGVPEVGSDADLFVGQQCCDGFVKKGTRCKRCGTMAGDGVVPPEGTSNG
jgi:hypothetical protein